jgi:hypothetical protein
MKISVLLYLCGREDDEKLERALVFAGIRVCRIGNLSNLHTVLASRSFSAVLVSRKTLAAHCMKASRHLWQSRSPHVIIEWERDADGSISWELHCLPSSVTGIPDETEREQKLAAITELLEKTNLAENREPAAQARQEEQENEQSNPRINTPPEADMPVAIPDSLPGPLHAKLRLVLETIAASGTAGIEISAIEKRIWGPESRNRTKDIQIYVSKLRKALNQGDITRFTIPFENRRYYLRKQA